MKSLTLAILVILLSSTLNCFAQTAEELQKKYTVFNRTISAGTEPGSIHLNDGAGEGHAWLNGAKFTNGTIEVDIKGKDKLQGSFVGITFHGVNDSTFEAIYFRPFNFSNPDTIRRWRAVQYISLPRYEWDKLREKFPGKYENKVNPVPGGDDWFHCKIIISGKMISVFVNNSSIPSLVVNKLTDTTTGKIGLWIENGSDGSFADLTITAKK